MPERFQAHHDLAGYLLGQLEPGERASFEAHLQACPDCRRELEALRPVTAMAAEAAPACTPPADLDRKVLAAVARAAEEDERRSLAPAGEAARPTSASRRWFTQRRSAGFALALAVVAALAVALPGDDDDGGGEIRAGEPELMARLISRDDPGRTASARVDLLDTGRVVSFDTDDLPILPKGEYYELWFVGPRDSREDPNRISAGTFHPDEQGRSRVRFHAAVEPAKYPVLSVTAEPGDGDPGPSEREVLRSER